MVSIPVAFPDPWKGQAIYFEGRRSRAPRTPMKNNQECCWTCPADSRRVAGSVSCVRQGMLPKLALLVGLLSLITSTSGATAGDAAKKLAEYRDPEYDYAFHYPADWRIRRLPEGKENENIRVVLLGPNSSSFFVVIEKNAQPVTKAEFESNPDRTKRVDEMIEQTIRQIYRTTSRNIQATGMKIGDRMDLSDERGIKFYISTLHSMPKGNSVIVAGIHVLPFSEEHMINFVMTTLWDPAKQEQNETLQAVFNSFRLIGEPPAAGPGSKP